MGWVGWRLRTMASDGRLGSGQPTPIGRAWVRPGAQSALGAAVPPGRPKHRRPAVGCAGGVAGLLLREFGESPLDQVQPARAGRREAQVEPRVGQQPLLDVGRLVGRIVVQDRMSLQIRWDFLVQFREELLNSAARWRRWSEPITLPVWLLRGRKEGRGAGPDVVVAAAFGNARNHRQNGLRPVQGLDLATSRPRRAPGPSPADRDTDRRRRGPCR